MLPARDLDAQLVSFCGLKSFSVILFGCDLRQPVPEGRRKLVSLVYGYLAYVACFGIGLFPNAIEVFDCDYSEYLGEGYAENYKRPKGRVSTYVANHVTGFDICAT